MSKAHTPSAAVPHDAPRLIGDREPPAKEGAEPRQGELSFPVPGGEPPLMPARMLNEYAAGKVIRGRHRKGTPSRLVTQLLACNPGRVLNQP